MAWKYIDDWTGVIWVPDGTPGSSPLPGGAVDAAMWYNMPTTDNVGNQLPVPSYITNDVGTVTSVNPTAAPSIKEANLVGSLPTLSENVSARYETAIAALRAAGATDADINEMRTIIGAGSGMPAYDWIALFGDRPELLEMWKQASPEGRTALYNQIQTAYTNANAQSDSEFWRDNLMGTLAVAGGALGLNAGLSAISGGALGDVAGLTGGLLSNPAVTPPTSVLDPGLTSSLAEFTTPGVGVLSPEQLAAAGVGGYGDATAAAIASGLSGITAPLPGLGTSVTSPAPGTTTTQAATPPASTTTTPPTATPSGADLGYEVGATPAANAAANAAYPSPDIWTQISEALGGVPGAITSGISSGVNSAVSGLTSGLFGEGGAGNVGSWLPAVIGAIIGGTQGQPAPITTDITPWNASYLNQGQAAAANLLNTNQLNLPAVPNLPVMDDAFVNQAIQAATAPMYYDFATKVMPAIRADFGDAYGSTRQDIAYGLGMDALARNAGNVGAQISSALYPSVFNSQVNAIQWPYQQQAAQAERKFTAPWENVTSAANIFTGASGRGATSNTQMPSTPWWQTAVGGAAATQGAWDKIFGGKQA